MRLGLKVILCAAGGVVLATAVGGELRGQSESLDKVIHRLQLMLDGD